MLEWTLGLKRLAYSRIDLSLCCSVSLHLKGTWETQNHQTFCALVTARQAGGYSICVSRLVLEWTLGLERLAYSWIDLSLCVLQRQSTSQGNMGDSEPPDILCESCACIIHTNLQSCMFIISETLHDHHI